MADTRERIYYLFDTVENENIMRRDTMDECWREQKKLNKKEGFKRYVCNGAWRYHIDRG